MAKVLPFRATRYNEDLNLSDVVCPPYDVLDDELIDHYKNLSPFNAVYLSRNAKDQDQQRYEHIPNILKDWHQKNTLQKDPEPYYYFGKDEFTFEQTKYQRHGIYAIIEVHQGTTRVIRHEHTLKAAIDDRLELLDQTNAYLSPIFLIGDDPQGEFYKLCTQAKVQNKQTFQTDQVQHEFGVIQNEDEISNIQDFFSNHDLLIADGHHRYKTALLYSEKTGKPAYVLAFITSSKDPGLVLSSIHRMVQSNQNASQWVAKHHEHFTRKPLSKDEFLESGAPFALVDYAFESMYLWTKDMDRIPSVVFQEEILEKRMDIDLRSTQEQSKVTYCKHNYNLDQHDDAQSKLTFWLKPMHIEEVFEVCKKDMILPQKTTYFYPKVLDGLVYFELNDSLMGK